MTALVGAVCSAAELFNGKDLAGWVSVADNDATGGYAAAEPTWSVVDGAIRTTGTPFGYLRTKRADFGDFKLKLQYRWWRMTERPNSGVFVRLAAETGTFIPSAEKAFGEWNTLEIEAKGDELVSRLNGVEMNRVKGVKTPKGAIALQSEGGAIEFRSVSVEE